MSQQNIQFLRASCKKLISKKILWKMATLYLKNDTRILYFGGYEGIGFRNIQNSVLFWAFIWAALASAFGQHIVCVS